MIDEFDSLLVDPMLPHIVIFSSYGNDSIALIQYAHEQGLKNVVVVYSDTGWAAEWWQARVEEREAWVRTLGFRTSRTTSIGFRKLALAKKAFPTQMYQWCSYILKIEPAQRWLAENDPAGRAICLVGVRREESQDRAEFPAFLLNSNSHGGRVMVAPMAEWTEEVRNEFIVRAGVEPLPHRSMECSPCINSNRPDLQALTEDDIAKAEAIENEMHEVHGLTSKGKRRTLFRPHRHMGALGVREVVRWANSKRGEYRSPDDFDILLANELEPEDLGSSGCVAGFCGA